MEQGYNSYVLSVWNPAKIGGTDPAPWLLTDVLAQLNLVEEFSASITQ